MSLIRHVIESQNKYFQPCINGNQTHKVIDKLTVSIISCPGTSDSCTSLSQKLLASISLVVRLLLLLEVSAVTTFQLTHKSSNRGNVNLENCGYGFAIYMLTHVKNKLYIGNHCLCSYYSGRLHSRHSKRARQSPFICFLAYKYFRY